MLFLQIIKEKMRAILKKMRQAYRHLFVTSGVVELTTGEYEIFIEANVDEEDFIEFEIDSCNHSTCSYLKGDKFLIKEVKEKGFLLKAEVESERVKFIWRVR